MSGALLVPFNKWTKLTQHCLQKESTLKCLLLFLKLVSDLEAAVLTASKTATGVWQIRHCHGTKWKSYQNTAATAASAGAAATSIKNAVILNIISCFKSTKNEVESKTFIDTYQA